MASGRTQADDALSIGLTVFSENPVPGLLLRVAEIARRRQGSTVIYGTGHMSESAREVLI